MKISDLKTIYLACTGNTCRSPLAQRIFQEELAQRRLPGIMVHSRRASLEDEPRKHYSRYDASDSFLSEGTKEVILAVYGDSIFANRHRSRAFSSDELQDSDLVIAMTMGHKGALTGYQEAFTQDKKVKVHTLGELIGAPHENVSDPIGSDQRRLERVYCQEQGVSLKKLRSKPCQEVTEKMLRYFSSDRLKQIRLAAYMPTYKELKEKISQLCDQEEIPVVSIEQLFSEEIERRRASQLRTSKGTIAFEDLPYSNFSHFSYQAHDRSAVTPDEMYLHGDYSNISEVMNNRRVMILKGLESVRKLLLQLPTAFGNDQNITRLCWKAKQAIHHTVVPSLLFGNYWRKDFTLDTASTSANLSPYFLETAPLVLKGMERSPLNEAFQIRKNATEMVNLAEMICSEEDLGGIYNEISKK